MESFARVILLLVAIAVMLALVQGGWGGVRRLINAKFAVNL